MTARVYRLPTKPRTRPLVQLLVDLADPCVVRILAPDLDAQLAAEPLAELVASLVARALRAGAAS